MPKKPVKTNVMRLLEQAGIPYEPLYYDLGEEPFSGEAVRRALGDGADRSFKTLCARGEKKGVAVFVIPLCAELNLKAAARALGDKAVALVHVRELPALTGYERGGVSPVGMKRRYPIVLDARARDFPAIKVSAGQIGVSVIVSPDALAAYLGADFAPVSDPMPEGAAD